MAWPRNVIPREDIAADLQNVTVSDLRLCCASEMVRRTLPQRDICRYLG